MSAVISSGKKKRTNEAVVYAKSGKGSSPSGKRHVVNEVVIYNATGTISLSSGKKERVNFLVSQELLKRAHRVAKESDVTLSDFIRNALLNYLEELERKRTIKELEEGYKVNTTYYNQMNKEWEAADAE